jgi:hypothetical protein
VVRGRSKTFGKDHVDTLLAQYSLAIVYHNQRRWGDASALLEDVVGRQERVLGNAHLDLYEGLTLLGNVYHMQGEMYAADKRFREALACAEKMADGEERIASAKRWLDHVKEMGVNGGVCYHMSSTSRKPQRSIWDHRKPPVKKSLSGSFRRLFTKVQHI